LSSNGEKNEGEEEIEEEFDADEERLTLPCLKPSNLKVGIWKVLKDSVGKDLTRFCVPGKNSILISSVYFNEPISMVQKITECMFYYDIIKKANASNDSLVRMAHVAAFMVS
jgi:hypothetical protein